MVVGSACQAVENHTGTQQTSVRRGRRGRGSAFARAALRAAAQKERLSRQLVEAAGDLNGSTSSNSSNCGDVWTSTTAISSETSVKSVTDYQESEEEEEEDGLTVGMPQAMAYPPAATPFEEPALCRLLPYHAGMPRMPSHSLLQAWEKYDLPVPWSWGAASAANAYGASIEEWTKSPFVLSMDFVGQETWGHAPVLSTEWTGPTSLPPMGEAIGGNFTTLLATEPMRPRLPPVQRNCRAPKPPIRGPLYVRIPSLEGPDAQRLF